MKTTVNRPPLTVFVLTYGDYFDLAYRCIESIRANTDRRLYRLIVGANAIAPKTTRYLEELRRAGHIDRLHTSEQNINKYPMMRRMFADVNTPYICWFDDDSYVTASDALERQLDHARRSPPKTVMWGCAAGCNHPKAFTDLADVKKFVRTASWYRGLSPPDWLPGGKGEFNFQGHGGDPWWRFILGGFWLVRTRAVRALDWPDPRLTRFGDVLLGEALRQHGWAFENSGAPGVAVNQAARRGEGARQPTVMERQVCRSTPAAEISP